MAFVVLALVIVLVIAVAVLVAQRRRLEERDRLIGSISRVAGVRGTDREIADGVEDLAEQARSTTVLANSYAAALQGVGSGIAILSGAGSIQYANPAAQLLLEGPREKAVLRTRVTALGQRVHTSGQPEVIEVDVHEPDRRVLALSAYPLEIEGGAVGAVCLYIDDLSAQRRVESMRTDFVANASHELKTPLGALALLAETLADTTDEELRLRLAQRLQSEASRMASVVDDVLQLAETESLGAEYSHVSVGEVLAEAVTSIESIAAESDITLIEDDVVDATVAADRKQLLSAITNLLNNAITYTAVKDEPGIVRYRAFREDTSICIEVEDTGIGIPSRYTDRVFERFFRVDRARSRESGGTGLGLSIVRNVARAHGGSVSVRSKVGVGSTFTVSLPVVPEEAG